MNTSTNLVAAISEHVMHADVARAEQARARRNERRRARRKAAKPIEAASPQVSLEVGPQYNELKSYLRFLCRDTGADISHWNLTEMFHSNGEWITSKQDINKIFFSRVTVTNVEITPTLRDKIERAKLGMTARLRDKIQRNISTAESDAEIYFTRYSNKLREITDFKREIDALNNFKLDTGTMINKIHEQGFWKLIDIIDNKKFIFRTTQNLVVHHKSRMVNVIAHFGMFQAEFDFSNSELKVRPFADNFQPQGTSVYHPHIHYSGDVCFGEARSDAQKFRVEGKLDDLMHLIRLILTQYNPASPYADIAGWGGHRVQNEPLPAAAIEAQAREEDEE